MRLPEKPCMIACGILRKEIEHLVKAGEIDAKGKTLYLKPKKMPQIAYFFGSSREIIEFMLACDTDGILLDKACDIEKTRGLIPGAIPLFGECGDFDMPANATPAEITDKVHRCLGLGFTTVCPLRMSTPPPAKIENIEAFVKALQGYQK